MARSKEIVATERSGTSVREIGLRETDDSVFPTPELLAKYDEYAPGTGDRILKLYEKFVDADIDDKCNNCEINRGCDEASPQ